MELVELSGVGKKRAEVIASLGINSVEDLLHYYPYKVNFIDYTDLMSETVIIKVKVLIKSRVSFARRNFNYFTFKGQYENKILTFKVFNQQYLHSKVNVDDEISVVCKLYKGDYSVQRILFNNEVPFIDVKYRSNSQINSKQIQQLISKALYSHHGLLEFNFDKSLIEKYKLFDIKQAVYLIHNPKNNSDYKNALRTLKYYEAYNFMKFLKDNHVKNQVFNFDDVDFSSNIQFIKSIPFELTSGQKSVLQDVYRDVSNSKRIKRLIHGDVGCGKTLVSIICAHLFSSNNYQVAILCPTEVLAKQMYSNYCNCLDDGVLLTSSCSRAEANDVYEKLESGAARFVVGTHSLLSDKVKFKNLGLVVIDEQHRFGVAQREKLVNKQENVNVLLMSATPIPRTMGLALFSNVDLTPILDVPKNRKKIVTEYANMLTDVVVSDIKNEIQKGNLIYVVVPAINDSETISDTIDSVNSLYNSHFSKKDIEIIHGKLKSEEQESVIESFKKGKCRILISTTVIEVGVDVANASRIIIHGASRFGLATLHQLRGRVGRSCVESKCYVINESLTPRLEIFLNCLDGFEISEADFKLRGPGNLSGNIQSGYDTFKLLDVFADFKILEAAKHDVG